MMGAINEERCAIQFYGSDSLNSNTRRYLVQYGGSHTQLATSAITNLYALGGWLSLIVEEERFPTCGALVILVITCYSSE